MEVEENLGLSLWLFHNRIKIDEIIEMLAVIINATVNYSLKVDVVFGSLRRHYKSE